MKKNYIVILMLVLCIICVGCGKKEEVQQSTNNPTSINSGDNIENKNNDSIEIIEGEEKIVVNMYDDLTTEYILSGDLVVAKREIYHFESEEKAQSFAESLSGDNTKIDGKDVIIEPLDEKLNLTKKDLIKTYKNLKEEYEYEQ